MAQITLNSSGVASNGSLLLQSNGTTTAVTIDTSQNVGIGTSTVIAGAKLNTLGWVASSNSNTDRIVIGQDARGTSTVFGLPTGSSWVAAVGNAVANALGIGTFGSDPLVFGTNNTERARIDSSGNLALGSTSILGSTNRASFTNTVSTKGVLALSNTSSSGYSAIELYDNAGGQQGAVGWGNGSVAVTGAQNATYLYSSGAITFLAGGTSERARIDSSGNFFVASTTADGLSTARIHSSRTPYTGDSNTTTRATQRAALSAYQDGGVDSNNMGSYCSLVLRLNAGLASNPGQLMRGYGGNGGDTYNIQIAASGNITNANNSYGSLSDESLKENIVDATPKLNDLMAVQVRNYNLKADEKKTKQLGVVAQELEAVFPAMVETEADGLKSVKYSVFVPMLIKAIQEQQAIIQTLTDRITALEQA